MHKLHLAIIAQEGGEALTEWRRESASRSWLIRLMMLTWKFLAQESRQTQQFGLSNAMACIRSAALRLQLLRHQLENIALLGQ